MSPLADRVLIRAYVMWSRLSFAFALLCALVAFPFVAPVYYLMKWVRDDD